MASTRTIYIVGEINEEAFVKFAKHLAQLERESSKEIEVVLRSDGGTAMDALAFRGLMRATRCHITVSGYGYVASAATMILISGNKRRLAKDSFFMVHEDSIGKLKGRTTDLIREACHAKRMEEHWNAIFTSATGIPISKWESFNRAETTLSAQECLDLGIVDEVF